MQQYYIYLRKSRKDHELELRGDGETLARHEKSLMELSHKMNLNITKIFREVVSGETIAARPKIQELLEEVEQGIPAGVLVMEVERLARGNTKDQGIVADAFRFGNVKIITPMKTYDPSDEFDEEYFEFGLFMSRREYKTINRRIQRGRLASVEEGKYIASTAPYGYKRVRIKNDKGYTLEINPEQAKIVTMIYDLYTKGELQDDGSYKKLGMHRICKKLDAMQIKPISSKTWSSSSIKDMLTNPTYIGKVRWKWRSPVKSIENGVIIEKRLKDKNCMIIDGLHEPIIDEDTFHIASQILEHKIIAPIVSNKELKNPLSGIVVCGKCGRKMTRVFSNTAAGYYSLLCPNKYCDNISSPIYLIEDKILDSLNDWLTEYKLKYPSEINNSDKFFHNQSALSDAQKQLRELEKQLESTYSFLETGVYTTDIFLQRNQKLTSQIELLTEAIENMENKLNHEKERERMKTSIIPQIENILEAYKEIESISLKNNMLKSVIEKVEYKKDTPSKKGQRDNANFKLKLYPKLPHS